MESLRLLNSLNMAMLLCAFPFLFPFVGAFFPRLFRIFYLSLLFFNDFDLLPYRIRDIYFKKPSEFNDVSQKVERPSQTDTK